MVREPATAHRTLGMRAGRSRFDGRPSRVVVAARDRPWHRGLRAASGRRVGSVESAGFRRRGLVVSLQVFGSGAGARSPRLSGIRRPGHRGRRVAQRPSSAALDQHVRGARGRREPPARVGQRAADPIRIPRHGTAGETLAPALEDAPGPASGAALDSHLPAGPHARLVTTGRRGRTLAAGVDR